MVSKRLEVISFYLEMLKMLCAKDMKNGWSSNYILEEWLKNHFKTCYSCHVVIGKGVWIFLSIDSDHYRKKHSRQYWLSGKSL